MYQYCWHFSSIAVEMYLLFQCLCCYVYDTFEVVPPVKSGQRLIDSALKMISGCIIPSCAIINSGSLSTTYLGSLLSGSHVSCHMNCVNMAKSSSSADVLSDVHQSDGLTFATTLFPVSTVLKSCFRQPGSLTDLTEYQSAILSFGAGNYHYSTAVL